MLYRCADYIDVAPASDQLNKAVSVTLPVQQVVLVRQNSRRLVIRKRKDAARTLTYREDWLADDWRYQPFEATSIGRQFSFKDGVVVIYERIPDSRNCSECTQGLWARHLSDHLKIRMSPLHPKRAISIEKDVLGPRIV